ncbi:hypothetical protein LOB43_02825 [Lactobacillus delbrueckii subsp. lactis]|nr:hypothetical protein [Lactobacillus delbrueckii subsp. lactis]MCD5531071.1 hypothetical protein [Lactobacillus delbrueckii subsp. lactis]
MSYASNLTKDQLLALVK